MTLASTAKVVARGVHGYQLLEAGVKRPRQQSMVQPAAASLAAVARATEGEFH
jgi:hypothetical protein